MWVWCPPSIGVKKKWIIRKQVGILANAGSAHVLVLLKRWSKEMGFLLLLFVCCDRVSLCSLDWSGTHGSLLASVFWVLGLLAWATMPGRDRLLFCEWMYVCLCHGHGRCLPLISILVVVVIISLAILCVCYSSGVGRIFCLNVWLLYIHGSSYLWRSEQDFRFIRTGVRSDCRPLCGCWKLNSGALEEQPVLLTWTFSLAPPSYFWDRISDWNWLVSERQGSAHLCLPILGLQMHAWLFTSVVGIWIQVLQLARQALCWLKLSSSCGSLVTNSGHQS